MKSLPASINTAMLKYPTGAQGQSSESDGVKQRAFIQGLTGNIDDAGGRGGDVKVEYLQLKVGACFFEKFQTCEVKPVTQYITTLTRIV